MSDGARPTMVAERPMSILDIVDGAFAILRRRPRTVATIAAAFVLPAQLITSWLNRGLWAALDFGSFDSSSGTFGDDANFDSLGLFSGSPIATVVQYTILPFLGVALTHLALGWRLGEDRTAGECLAFTVRRTHVILVALVLSKLIQAATLLLTTPMTMLVAPVIAAERTGPWRAIRRAFQLGRRRYGPLFALLLMIVLINVLLGYAMLTLPVIGAFLLDDWGWVAYFALGLLGTTVLAILGTGAAALAYIDVTNRTEGADIARRLAVAQSRRG